MYSLSDMPDIPMDLILKHVGFPAILVLQKVSSNFRNYIDDKKPDFNIDAINIFANCDEVKVDWICGSESCNVCYTRHSMGCTVSNGCQEKILGDCSFMDAFCNDLKIIMAHQKSALKRFHVDLRSAVKSPKWTEFMNEFEKTLKSISIKTKCLGLGIKRGDEIMSILPYVQAKHLEEIRFFGLINFDETKFDEISRLEQWKNARKFTSQSPTYGVSMKHFTHFPIINAKFVPIRGENLNVLKQAAMKSASFEMFQIGYNSVSNYAPLDDLFGTPFTHIDGFLHEKKWFFNTCNSGKVLEIVSRPHFRVDFSLIEVHSVPIGAEVKNE